MEMAKNLLTKKGFLILETGKSFSGILLQEIEYMTEQAWEVVFNTSHTGYEEIATDPSYCNQILVLTSPMQGNYGSYDNACESQKIWINGLVCLELQNSEREHSWNKRLIDAKIPVLTNCDTRSIVLYIREKGSLFGVLVQEDNEIRAKEKAKHMMCHNIHTIKNPIKTQEELIYKVSRKQKKYVQGLNPKGPRISILDFGIKNGILNKVLTQSSEVMLFPAQTIASDILDWSPQGIVLSNGPGDPSCFHSAIKTIKKLLGEKPIFGICMGHQILVLALGGSTFKMKFGHRGSNHPIRDFILNKTYVTSQNHGYAIVKSSLPNKATITQINLNDQTVEGFECHNKKCFGIQYHPESRPGPHDAASLFDYFIENLP